MIPADRNLAHLQPEFRLRLEALLRLARADGYPLVVIEGWRSPERQAELWAKGRTTPGPIVTRAKLGQSLHEYGLGADLAFLDSLNQVTWQGPWGRLYGWCRGTDLEWGGQWFRFPDRPHVQAGGWTWQRAAKKWPGGWRSGDTPVGPPRVRGKIPDKADWTEFPEGWV